MLSAHGVENALDGRVLDGFGFGERRFGSGLGVILRIEVVVSSWVYHKPLLEQARGENGLRGLRFGCRLLEVKRLFHKVDA
jgi:hypothetical protein